VTLVTQGEKQTFTVGVLLGVLFGMALGVSLAEVVSTLLR
jgi:hypothetical protein